MLIVIRITADLSPAQLLAFFFVFSPSIASLLEPAEIPEVSCFCATAAFYRPRAQGRILRGRKCSLIVTLGHTRSPRWLREPGVFVPKEKEERFSLKRCPCSSPAWLSSEVKVCCSSLLWCVLDMCKLGSEFLINKSLTFTEHPPDSTVVFVMFESQLQGSVTFKSMQMTLIASRT